PAGAEAHCGPNVARTTVDERGNGQPDRLTCVARFVHDEHSAIANLRRRLLEHGRGLANRLRTVPPTHKDRVELTVQNRGDGGTRDHAGRGDPHNDLRIELTSYLEGQGA